MNIRTILAVSTVTLAAAACTSTSPARPTTTTTSQPTYKQPTYTQPAYQQPTTAVRPNEVVSRKAKFECRNGMTVTLTQNNVDSLNIYVDTDNSNTNLYRTQAASGSLYTNKQGMNGKLTEWHEKGGQAVFAFSDPYNNVTETTCLAK